MKYCKNCRKVLGNDAEICDECGCTEFLEETNGIKEIMQNANQENQKEQDNKKMESLKVSFWKNLKAYLCSTRALVLLAGCLILCVLALVYFAIQIRAFSGTATIYGACILIEIIWAFLSALCLTLFVFSIVFNVKRNKQK